MGRDSCLEGPPGSLDVVREGGFKWARELTTNHERGRVAWGRVRKTSHKAGKNLKYHGDAEEGGFSKTRT